MKKVIDGKMYNTESAKFVALYESRCGCSDFRYYFEELYLKKTGEFFLYGEGHAASPYAKSCGLNEWCHGWEIIPLSVDDAKKWAEQSLDGDEYEKIFGVVEE